MLRERGDSNIQEAGEDGYGSRNVTYFSGVISCGLMAQSHYFHPHDPRVGGKCLFVWVFVCIQPDIASIIFFRGV